MDTQSFIKKYQKAFGQAELPMAFWYSNEVMGETPRSKGCFIPDLRAARQGKILSFSKSSITCPGGRVFSGFEKPFPMMTRFVSTVEGYKEKPEMVKPYLPKENPLGLQYLHFARIDKLENLDALEGIIFFTTPDVLSGLCTWAFYDNNQEDAVSTVFGSGCSSIVTKVYEENQRGGSKTFLGMLDPSARKGMDSNSLTFAVPLSRFRTMYTTMEECFLWKNKAWKVLRDRSAS